MVNPNLAVFVGLGLLGSLFPAITREHFSLAIARDTEPKGLDPHESVRLGARRVLKTPHIQVAIGRVLSRDMGGSSTLHLNQQLADGWMPDKG